MQIYDRSEQRFNTARSGSRQLSEDHALQFLALVRSLANRYDISSSWARVYRHALLGVPAIRKLEPEQASASAALEAGKDAGRNLVTQPGETLRGLLLGIEEGMHGLDINSVMIDGSDTDSEAST